MRLLKMQLNGFKSFSDKISIKFSQNGITTFVGPNGCGKSNIVDALRWALGEQSAKTLRGAAMFDVIFSGTGKRHAAGFCEVSLTFLNEKNNSKFKYEDFPEIVVTRRLYQDGESEYLINKKNCRLLDIKDLFVDTGLGGGRGYSIIEQGSIGTITTSRPLERRTLVEEAAGVVKFKQKKIEAEKKLAETHQNILRIGDILSELKTQETTLGEQAKRAREYFEIKGKIERSENLIKAKQWHASTAKLEAISETIANDNLQLQEVQVEFNVLDNKLLTKKNDLLLIEKQLEEKRALLEKITSQKQVAASDIQLKEQQKIDLTKWQQKSKEEKLAHQKLLTESSDKIARTRQKLQKIKEQLATLKKQEDAQQKISENLTLEIKQKTTRLAELAENKLELSSKHAKLETLILALTPDSQHPTRQDEDPELMAVDHKLSDIAQKLTSLDSEQSQIALDITNNQKTLTQQQQELDEQKKIKDELNQQVNNYKKDLEQKEVKLLKLQATTDSLHPASKALNEFLKEMSANPKLASECGWRGLLTDFLEYNEDTPKTWLYKMEPYLRLAVFESQDKLPLILDLCQRFSLDDFKFSFLDSQALPLPDVMAGKDMPVVVKLPNSNRFLNNLLLAKDQLSGEISAELGDASKNLTKDALGAFVYYHPRRQNAYQEEQKLLKMIKQTTSEKETSQSLLNSAQAKLKESLLKIADYTKKLTTLNLKLKELTAEKKGNVKLINRLSEEQNYHLKVRDKKVADFEKQLAYLAQHKEKIKEHEKELSATAKSLQELTSLQEKENQQLTTLDAQKNASLKQLHDIKLKVNNSENEYNASRQLIFMLDNEIKDHREKLIKLDLFADSSFSDQQEHQRKLTELGELVAELSQQMTQISSNIHTQKESYNQDKYAITEQETELAKKSAKLRELESKIEISQVKLDQLKAEKIGIETELFEFKSLKPQEVIRTFDVENFDDKLEYNKLKNLKVEFAGMSDVNLNAQSEYEKLFERLSFLDKQHQDLLFSVASLEESIKQIKETSEKLFLKAFHAINQKFKEIFPVLFGGGSAGLLLLDEQNVLETGVDISVSPPGKKTRNVNLLSGGEKALTAIALIVAIFLYKPSPFCVLDEVDAPLDINNIKRFCGVIESLTPISQFIMVTHNPKSMAVADYIYGVTMEESGVSKIVSVDAKNLTVPEGRSKAAS